MENNRWEWMAKQSKGEVFLEKVKQLSNKEMMDLAGKDAVIIIGPTGAGKSTILNQLAGSRIFSEKIGRKWVMNADPDVAKIGHTISETFSPNIWISPQGKYFIDFPGFKDTRGGPYEMAKSLFFKMLNGTKSFKILLVTSRSEIEASRCGQFSEIINEIEKLIQGFSVISDCHVMITKVLDREEAQDFLIQMNKKIAINIPYENLSLIYEPDYRTGAVSLPNIHQIVKSIVTIKKQCRIPISEASMNKIYQLIDQFNQSIKDFLDYASQMINITYLCLLFDNLQVPDETVMRWHTAYSNFMNSVTDCDTVDTFLIVFCSAIDSLYDLGASCGRRILKKVKQQGVFHINRMINNLQFLFNILPKQKSNVKVHRILEWKTGFNFKVKLINKSKCLAKIRNQQKLKLFFNQLAINIQANDVRSEVHSALFQSYQFSAPYSGNQPHMGSKNYSGVVKFSEDKIYNGCVKYDQEFSFSQQIPYSGTVEWKGSTSERYCSHTGCMEFWSGCSHDYQDYYAQGVVQYKGNQYYENKVRAVGVSQYHGKVAISGDASYSGTMQYSLSIPYSGYNNVLCSLHHKCCCGTIVQILKSIKEAFEDISYFTKLISLLRNLLGLSLSAYQIQQTNRQYFISQFDIDLNQINFLDSGSLSELIHNKFSKSHQFFFSYNGSQPYSITKNMTGFAPYIKTQYYSGYTNCIQLIPHSSHIQYYGYVNYEGTTQKLSCQRDCSWCTGKNWKTLTVSGLQKYQGTKYFNINVKFEKQKFYEGYVQAKGAQFYSQSVTDSGTVSYNGQAQAICPVGSLNQHHHGCDGCDKLTILIASMKKILKQKEQTMIELNLMKQKLKHELKLTNIEE